MPLATTERFSNRADAYVRGRPTYPQAIVEQLQVAGALKRGQHVVDIGVGTGLSAEPFLRSGYTVIGVEPNAPMRTAGDQQLREFPRLQQRRRHGGSDHPFRRMQPTLSLPARHFTGSTCSSRQSRYGASCAGGWAALIWNDRESTGSAFLAGYEALLRTHGIDYGKLIHRHVDEKSIAQFFAPAQAVVATFDNPRELEREDLLALAGSASYLPAPGDPRHAVMMLALNALFDSHAKNGTVQMMYRTRMHYARVN